LKDRFGSLSTKSMWPCHVGYYPNSDYVVALLDDVAQTSADPDYPRPGGKPAFGSLSALNRLHNQRFQR
jgi:hypothetical protein